MIAFWASALALSLLLYVVLDGFDLGVGMLFGIAPDEAARRHMMQAIAPVWDGNETWLVVAGTILFGAFPAAYALLLSAFYLPLLAMLAALILRGVAFEFRYKARRLRRLWDAGFVGGSAFAAFAQGAAVGALVEELPIANGQYAGGPFGWLSPFAVLCGFGLCLGYALLGAAWLCNKTEADVRDLGYRLLPRLLVGVLLFLAAAFAYALAMNLRVLHRWFERPEMLILPLVGAAACAGLVHAARRRIDALPFPLVATIFAAAFATLAASFLPYMVPFTITIEEAAAPPSSLSFLFWGAGVVVLPITLIYTVVVYRVFKGKVDLSEHAGHYE
ncbi:cytochrome d ubiquinol oxidase subunit II [Methylobacterium sp. NEAU 140]|uniref:cytochrome d ubiquinol oxidase subunit II n=1 Tax=Methylobacterium sp. NEAU 140 TaxID=3064945 RepID=UPI002732A521|nr:cytochrome d ubiquinol oxidase subunit II [Methylobacterium sp. NEAU 140]MDP4024617.1 cytochrome d ubiquinol oxidase subunit II [Methylobacterium sp. NEAU 140]